MKLSTKARYGLRAMLDLAEHGGEKPVQARVIAERGEISPKYLEHLLASLKAAGLVKVERGAHGGYQLSRDAGNISLGEVVRALEGSVALVDCVNDPTICTRSARCATHDVWKRLKEAMDGVLEGTSLSDLAERHSEKCAAVRPAMYNI